MSAEEPLYPDGAGGTLPSQAKPKVISTYTVGTATVSSSTFTSVVGLPLSGVLQNAANKWKISFVSNARIATAQSSAACFTVFRDGVDIVGATFGLVTVQTGGVTGPVSLPFSILFYDTPGDTLSHTYTIAIRNTDNATQVSFWVGAVFSLEEILV